MNEDFRIEAHIPPWLCQSRKFFGIVTDLLGYYQYVNDFFAAEYAHLGDSFVGKNFAMHVHPDDVYLIAEKGRWCLANPGKTAHAYIRKPSLNGTYRTTEWELSALFDGSGGPWGILGIGIDITGSRIAEASLQERDEMLQALTDSAFDGIYITRGYSFSYVNDRLCQLLGYSRDELTHPAFDIKSILTPQSQATVHARWEARMQRKPLPRVYEFQVLTKDGQIRDVETSTMPLKPDPELRVLGIMKDITERKQVENDIRTALDIVSEQNQRLLNFTYIISHNIRSHASNIQGLLQIMDMMSTAEERSELESYLKQASENLMTTIDDLNKVVVIQKNINEQKSTLNLCQHVEKTLDILKGEAQMMGTKVQNDITSEMTVEFNAAYLDSILLNLLSNAIKYRRQDVDSTVILQCERRDGQVVLTVTDNGLGIDLQKYGDKIFNMYKTFHDNADARGLGLFITKNQLEALGGKIEVESTVGQGSTFRVFFACNN